MANRLHDTKMILRVNCMISYGKERLSGLYWYLPSIYTIWTNMIPSTPGMVPDILRLPHSPSPSIVHGDGTSMVWSGVSGHLYLLTPYIP